MTDDAETLTKNTLFLAVTRPALWAGIPIEAAVLLLISSASVLIWSNSPIYAALVVAFGYSISRLIVRHDVNAFRLLFLWGRTKAGNRNRAFWGGSSYSPLPLTGLRRKGFGRGGFGRNV
jgi:type IV secretion system protein VirB3